MKHIAYTYEAPVPLNLENLGHEVDSSYLPGYVGVATHDGNVEVSFSAELSASDKTALQDIIDNHDGLPARTSEALQRKREIIFSRIVDMAHRHPVLKVDDTVNTPPHTGAFAISDYLRSIDNYVNQWKRDGNQIGRAHV